MPELPEVETIRRELAPRLEGLAITGVRVHHPDIVLQPEDADRFRRGLRGRRIQEVRRRAKYLLFLLDRGRVLETQLRMTGRFALGSEPPERAEFHHLAAEFDLDDGRTLFYDDVRRLGGFRLQGREEWARRREALGPEPLSDTFGTRDLSRALSGGRAPVKNRLLDQRRLAGVGNIYAAEALHAAGVDPRRPAGSLNEQEVVRLHATLRDTLRSALRHAGTTVRDYRAVNGRSGTFQHRLRVYGREGEECRRCGEEILRIVQAGRSTFFCPGCQG